MDSFADTIKRTFDIATEAASKALEPEPLEHDEGLVVVPTPPEPFVTNPVPPIVAIVKKRVRKKSGVDTSGRITPDYDIPVPETPLTSPRRAAKKVSKKKSVPKAVKKVAKKSKQAAKKSISKKTVKKQRRSAVTKKRAKRG